MDLPPPTRFIQAAVADNLQIAKLLFQQDPDCRNYLVHAICGAPNPKSACFEFLKKEASVEQLTEAEGELKLLIENSNGYHKQRETAEAALDTIKRERTRRALKPDDHLIEL